MRTGKREPENDKHQLWVWNCFKNMYVGSTGKGASTQQVEYD